MYHEESEGQYTFRREFTDMEGMALLLGMRGAPVRGGDGLFRFEVVVELRDERGWGVASVVAGGIEVGLCGR